MAKTKTSPAVVDAFLHDRYFDPKGNRLLHYWKERFWKWDGYSYVKRDEPSVWREFFLFLETSVGIPSRSDWSTVKELLEYRVSLAPEQAMPAWTSQVSVNTHLIAFQNGLLDVRTGNTQPNSPLWFSANCLPFAHDTSAACPKWLEFLGQVFEGDQERICQLQEWFGYCLTPDTSLHKALLLQGRPRSGKSTIVRVLSRLLGGENVSYVALELFSEQFYLILAEGKLVNVAEEVNRSKMFDEGRFKTFVAGDPLMVAYKGKTPYPMTPTARLVMTANEQMHIQDLSGAIAERLLVIPFDVSFAGREDRELESKLVEELPGIFNWAYEGHTRLRASRRFSTSAAGERELRELLESNNPLMAWATECLAQTEGARTPSTMIYESYAAWCKRSQVKPIGKPRLARAFKMALGLPAAWTTTGSNGLRYWPNWEVREWPD